MKYRKTMLLLVASLLVAAFLLAACSSDEPTAAPTEIPATEVPATAVPTAEVAAPDEGAASEAVMVLPVPAEGEPTLTALVNVNVRSGPGEQYPVFGVLAGGKVAKLVGINAERTHFAVEFPLASTGSAWIDAQFVTVSGADNLPVLEAPPVPPTTEFTPPEAGDPQVIIRQETFVRSGPGANFPAYGIATDGMRGLLLGISEDGAWWAVRINPEIVGVGHGWVEIALVDEENVPENPTVIKTPPMPAAVAPPPPAEGAATATAVDFLNVRSGPGTNYPVLVVVPPGATGEIAGRNADSSWWQVKISTDFATDGLGWVSADFVISQNTENVPVVGEPSAPPTNPNPPSSSSYSCILVSQSPVDGTVFQPGMTFDTTWEVQNVGTETWTTTNSMASKIGAVVDQPLSSVTSLPLSQDVAAGATYLVSVPMTAPAFAGQFGEYWTITLGGETVCYFYNVIQVQE